MCCDVDVDDVDDVDSDENDKQYWRNDTEILLETLVPVPLRLHQTLHGLARY